jgi:hypothetical protein
MSNVPTEGSKWVNRRTREVHTVAYHPCGPAAGFCLCKPGKGYGQGHMFTSDDDDMALTSRYEPLHGSFGLLAD